MPDGHITVSHVGRRFRRFAPNAPRTLKEWFARGFRGSLFSDYFWALQDVSVEVGPGQVLGIIGRNGSGKSTLLRLMGGIGRPDRGTIRRRGRIGSLLDLGVGFHPDLTGTENVFVNGSIYGLTRAQIRARMDSIVEFAELGAFMGSPLRTYSSGMSMRLAFSVAIHSDPDILLVDEVLSVGDLAFQKKCLQAIDRFQASGCAIVMVTHDINQVRQMATTALWLNKGQVIASGPPSQVTDLYRATMEGGAAMPTGQQASASVEVSQSAEDSPDSTHAEAEAPREIEITSTRLLGADGAPLTSLQSGGSASLEINYRVLQPVSNPIFFVSASREDGAKCFQIHTEGTDLDTSRLAETGSVRLAFERIDLCEGEHHFDVAVFRSDWSSPYHYVWHALAVQVEADGTAEGVYNPPAAWQIAVMPDPSR